MADSKFYSDQKKAQLRIREYNLVKKKYESFLNLNQQYLDLFGIYELLKMEHDHDLYEEYLKQISEFITEFDHFQVQMLLSDTYDQCDAIFELHAGAGGVDSQDWTLMLYRMYTRYFEHQGFKVELLNYQTSDEAGIRTASMIVKSDFAYGLLKGEYGVHRLVRISPFDAAKKRHTSFALVEVLPVIEDHDDLNIHEHDLKVDTFRAQGAGGQSVNTTDSAVRITHLPTGIVVSCQNERSQIKNRAQALKLLQAKLLQHHKNKETELINNIKGDHKEVGFSSQIRSYVLNPYQLVKDHRTGYETGQVDKVLDGDLDEFIKTYLYYLKQNNL